MNGQCLLAIDASSAVCDIAVCGPHGVVSQAADQPGSHASDLMASLNTLLQSARIDISDLDGVVYGCGPGSFTGVRIGVAVAQGIAHAAGLPMLPISSLHNIAEQVFAADASVGALQVAIDARMGEWYVAQFSHNAAGPTQERSPATLATPQQWLQQVAVETPLFIGLPALPADLQQIADQRGLSLQCGVRTPSARVALTLAQAADPAVWHHANAAAPSYVRDKVAETIAERQAR